jgi:hypothetical protein
MTVNVLSKKYNYGISGFMEGISGLDKFKIVN